MNLSLIMLTVALVGYGIASIYDLFFNEVEDYITYGIVAVASILRVIFSIVESNWSILWFGLIGFGFCWILGVILYKSNLWGGADSKILFSLGILFSEKLLFVLSSFLIIGTIYMALMQLFLCMKFRLIKNYQIPFIPAFFLTVLLISEFLL